MMVTLTYILGMTDTAKHKIGLDPATLGIQRITCTGEPGAGIPSTKKRIQEAWNAKVHDHADTTEIGDWSFECMSQPGGMHVSEAFFLYDLYFAVRGGYLSQLVQGTEVSAAMTISDVRQP